MNAQRPQVGAPDPQRDTSPLFDEEEEISLELEPERSGCHFNDAAYSIGDCVRSGNELLQCEKPGVWVRRAEMPTKACGPKFITLNQTCFPTPMRDLSPLVREKAIDIANALLEEGVEEREAIPLAIAKAKEWACCLEDWRC